jgi:hypothetical protein
MIHRDEFIITINALVYILIKFYGLNIGFDVKINLKVMVFRVN